MTFTGLLVTLPAKQYVHLNETRKIGTKRVERIPVQLRVSQSTTSQVLLQSDVNTLHFNPEFRIGNTLSLAERRTVS